MKRLEDLPEPVELHRAFAGNHPLDWGDRTPTKAGLLADFGELASRRALESLAAIGWRDAAAISDLQAVVAPDLELYQPDRRVKSPQSLARKIKKYTGKRQQVPVIEDVQRYTVLTSVHGRLPEVTRRSADNLRDLGWQLTAVRNSYVDGSRYKGIHLNTLDPRGQRIEIQVQSRAAIAVKDATTRPYELARDDELPRVVREQARLECIRLTACLPNPVGLDQLSSLIDFPVSVQGYGLDRGQPKARGRRTTGLDRRADTGRDRPIERGREL
ncbi:hypothetical protein ACWEOO_31120 [Kribbella sp. NPDC004138]